MGTSSNFLPPYLQTTTNKKFLSGTLDLLTSKPELTRFDGFIGRQIDSSGNILSGTYLPESTGPRQNYQLEPAFVTFDDNHNITNISNFIDLLNNCANKESNTTAWNRLLSGNTYSYKGFLDTDKIVNYQNYVWMSKSSENGWFWNSVIPTNDVSTNIIGQENYSLNNLSLMNGMIISTTDSNTKWIVEGVNQKIVLVSISNTITPTFILNQNNPPDYITINRSAIDLNLWSRTNLWIHKDTLNSIIAYLNITPTPFQYALRPILEFNPMVLFGYGKIGINPVSYYDAYTPNAISIVQGSTNFEVDGFQLNDGDSVIFGGDKNSLVRNSVYTVNFIDPTLINQIPRLYPVKTVSTTDLTLTGIQTINGYKTISGDRILLNGQSDSSQNGIWIVSDGSWTLADDFHSMKIIHIICGVLVLTSVPQTYYIYNPITNLWNATLNIPTIQLVQKEIISNNDTSTIITNGTVYLDKTVIWNNNNWSVALQNKTAINQSPLFDIFDLNGNSFSDNTIYSSSSFSGSKLFSYELGSGANDSILGFPLSFGPIGNINDVLFENNYTTDIFSYTTNIPVPQKINSGRTHIIDPLTQKEDIYDSWQYVTNKLELYQNLVFVGSSNISFNGKLLVKSTPNSQQTQVFIDGSQLSSNDYSVTETNGTITIVISSIVPTTSIVFVKILSSIPIPNAWYDVPTAFESNPFGKDLTILSMSVIRNHINAAKLNSNYTSDILNLQLNQFQGVLGSLLYNESLSILPTLSISNNDFDIDQAIRNAGDSYTLFKQKLINSFSNISNISNLTTKQAVDAVLKSLSFGNILQTPWASSDMCAYGGNVQQFNISNVKRVTFNLNQTYIWNQPNQLSLQIYLNNQQLINNIDYHTNDNILTITKSLNIGDKLSIYEIFNTNGCYIPATPTKLGLAAAYVPQIYLDTTYQTPRNVLQGHDGSITECFNDYRDNLLLDYELRVYNNLKVNNQLLVDTIQSYVPMNGRFRSELSDDIAPYSPSEQLTISQRMFFEWVSQYNINNSNTNTFYDPNNLFTWNWSSSLDKLSDHQTLLGYWRGIYNWFYDSENPNTRPWEMLNISVKPIWWDSVYGPSPYSGGNLVMWNDIADGIIRNPSGISYSSYGRRNSVLSVIPVDEYGNLLNPNQSVIGIYNDAVTKNNFVYGDGDPVETAWKRSSVYPFSKLRSQILQNPLFMMGTLWDTNNYLPTNGTSQFRFQTNFLGSVDQIQLNSVDNNGTTLVNSILNYSIEYLRSQGKDPSILRDTLDNTPANLAYNLGGYADANNITVLATPNNPNDVGAAELISNKDYSLFLNESSPVGVLTYSGLIISIAPNNTGYIINGYDKVNPYFIVYAPSIYSTGLTLGITSPLFTYPQQFNTNPSIVPYNTIFGTQQEVINFIAGYHQFLISEGLEFSADPSQDKIDWVSGALQFIKWSLTNWNSDQNISIIINPASSILNYSSATGTLYDLTDVNHSLLIDVDGNIIDYKFLDVYRDGNQVTITHQGGGVFACIRANIVNYEHRFVINNTSSFNDTIYEPITGNRQIRLQLSGQKTGKWNGTLDCPGFLICTNKIDSWVANQDYLQGSIVQWKNNNYVALNDIIGGVSFQYSQFSLINNTFTNSILPNLSLKAVDYVNAYNSNYQPYISDLIKLRNNTIGYIERDWLNLLDIDLSSQSNFYRGWIKEKGTINSLNSYGRGASQLLNTQVTINEEYAMKVGEYGADSRTGYGEISLPPSINTKNPLIISFVDTLNVSDTITTQIVPFNLYEKSANWTNEIIQTSGNLKASNSSFLSAGPVIPSRLIAQSYKNIPDFITSDEDSLFFANNQAMTNSANQHSILKIAENGGSFWIGSNQIASGPNQWDVIRFDPAITNILSITQLNPQTLSFNLTSNINAIANSVIIVDHIDNVSNVSIQGVFIVADYFIENSFANLILTTNNSVLSGNTITYSSPWNSTSLYISESLRGNSIAESDISPYDNTRYVSKDEHTWAEYDLLSLYNTEINYENTPNQVSIQSISYDGINEILWFGKPSATNNSGVVEFRKLNDFITSTNNLVSISVESYNISSVRSDTNLLGETVVCSNIFGIASANSSNISYTSIGQLYVINNKNTPTITQILSADNIPVSNNLNFGKHLSISTDGTRVFASWNVNPNVSNINIYSLNNDIPSTYNVISQNTSLITVNSPINDQYSITISINFPNSLTQILIPGLEYIIDPTNNQHIILIGDPVPGIAGATVTIIGLPQYYKYLSTINCNQSISSLDCNEDGSVVVVGNSSNNSVSIFKLFNPIGEYSLTQTIVSPTLTDSLFGNSVAVQNNQLLVGSPNNNLNNGKIYLYELDTQIATIKTIPISSIIFPISLFKINSYDIISSSNISSSNISSLVTNINSRSNYTGIIASNNDTTLFLSVDNLSLQTNGLVNNPSDYNGQLYSNFILTNQIISSDKGSNFGKNIKWLSSDLFGTIEDIGSSPILSESDVFSDGTYYDGNNTNFTEYTNKYSQNLKIYQVLFSNRSWINSNIDILKPVLVKSINIIGNNYPSTEYVGDISNLFIVDSNNPDNSITIYNNVNYVHGWTKSTYQELPMDSTSISKAWIYDSITKTKLLDLEIVDINAGILPRTIASYIDYICDSDPANYNIPRWLPSNIYSIGDRILYNGNLYQSLYSGKSGSMFNASLWKLINPQKIFEAYGPSVWGGLQVGKTWFKTKNLRAINAQLGTIQERAANWNQWFPNSNIEVYEWVNSIYSPSNYVSSDTTGYVLDSNCPYTFDTNTGLYGFWVYDKTIPNSLHSTISVDQIITELSNIPNSGIPIISGIDNNVIAIWNINQFISSNTVILHIDYVSASGDNQLHSEFALISNNGSKSWYNTPIYPKLVDSLSGVNTLSQLTPDITIPSNQQTGILTNPQQSIFVDRTKALDIYFTSINEKIANVAIASSSVISSLSINDPLPTNGFDESIPSREVLNELDINNYPENYKILIIIDDSLTPNSWSIVSSINGIWEISQIQLYNLSNNWEYTNWFSSDYVKTTPTYTLNNFGQLSEISYNLNDTILIQNIGNGNQAIYTVVSNDLNPNIIELAPIFIENGTIQFLSNLYDFNTAEIGFDMAPFDTQGFDNDPYLEIRLITQILNDTILTGSNELTKIADSAFYAVLQYIIHENKNLDWLFKTSFITVDYINRNLNIQGPYISDNQSVIQDFINESIPFHTRIREFHNTYTVNDYGNIGIVDFDLPSQYDSNYANIVINYNDNIKPNGLLQISQFDNNVVGVSVDEDSFYITSNGLSLIPSLSNAISQNWSFGFPQEINNSSIQFNTVTNISGPIGSATNGIPFYSSNSGIKETLYQSGNIANSATYTINTVWKDQQNNIDTGVGLPNNDGVCQYLTDPYLLYTKNNTVHSPLLGYAWDGVPIYGPYGNLNNDGSGGIILNTSSYKLSTTPRLDKTGFSITNGLQLSNYSAPTGEYIEDYVYNNGLGSLDQNNGRFCTTSEYPNGTYAYFVSIDSIYLKPTYPYIIGPTYYGVPYGLTYKYINGENVSIYPNGKVSLPSVNIANISNFIRTPDGSVSSDSLTLTQPIYSSWDNNHINNSQLIRTINTTLRFDRVNSDIEYLESNAIYPKGEILYNNSGIFVQALINNANSANISFANTWANANSMVIATSTAMNRITADYFPNSNMFAKQARLLLNGVSYPEVIVSDGPFVESYSIPTESIFDQDDQFAGNVALNLSWHSKLLYNNGLSQDTFRFGNSSASFDSNTNRYIVANSNISSLAINSNAFTLEFFINFSNISNNIMTMVDTRSNISSNSGMVIYNKNGNLCFGSNTNVAIISSNIVPFINNDWNFITLQGSSSNIHLYNNGLLIGDVVNQYYNFSDANLTLGADTSGNNICCGFMDEIRLTNNINRYNIDSINIDVPSAPFPRGNNDSYIKYTPLLYGFETYHNEGESLINFASLNSKTYINDLSWNIKNMELINYNTGNIIIDSNENLIILN